MRAPGSRFRGPIRSRFPAPRRRHLRSVRRSRDVVPRPVPTGPVAVPPGPHRGRRFGDMGLVVAQAMRATARVGRRDRGGRERPQRGRGAEGGIIVVIGDARERAVLSRARIQRARRLVVSADDATNLEVLVQAQELATERRWRRPRLPRPLDRSRGVRAPEAACDGVGARRQVPGRLLQLSRSSGAVPAPHRASGRRCGHRGGIRTARRGRWCGTRRSWRPLGRPRRPRSSWWRRTRRGGSRPSLPATRRSPVSRTSDRSTPGSTRSPCGRCRSFRWAGRARSSTCATRATTSMSRPPSR